MTKPKLRPCPNCQQLNQANKKMCVSCFTGLGTKASVKTRKEKYKDGEWSTRVKKHNNLAREIDSAKVTVSQYVHS